MTSLEQIGSIEEIPFGRSRALKLIGAALLASATQVVMGRAVAGYDGSPPSPCFAFGSCHCCNTYWCCESGCTYPDRHTDGCPGGGQCWTTCSPPNYLVYQCCDWHCNIGPDPNNCHCLCKWFTGQYCA